MVGEGGGYAGSQKRTPSSDNAPTQPASLPATLGRANAPSLDGSAVIARARLAGRATGCPRCAVLNDAQLPPVAPVASRDGRRHARRWRRLNSAAPSRRGVVAEVEVSEVVHDPELDEAVIAFANADFTQCEQALSQLVGTSGSRAPACRDLARAVRSVPRDRAARALRIAGGRLCARSSASSPPQWFSLPKLVAEAAAEERPSGGGPERPATSAGCAPTLLDVDAIARLRSVTAAVAAAVGVRLVGLEARRPRCGCPAVGVVAALGHAVDRDAVAIGRALPHRDCRTRRPPECAMPIRPTGCCGLTRCACPTGPTSSTRRRSTTA